jgi:regulator of RNase E activity RraA
MRDKRLGKYKNRLLGLIPEDRIVTVDVSRPPRWIIEEFKKLKGLTPTVSDILDSMGIRGAVSASVIKPLQQGKMIVGPAITLRYILERNTTTSLFVEKAKAKLGDRDLYAVSEPGDVAVFDVGGRIISTQGGLSTLMAKRVNLAGNIVDGGVRDIEYIRELDYPVWARGVTPITGKYRLEAIEINGPIMCCDVQVYPGDLVIADDTGIVFIPSDKSEEVLAKTKAAIERENKIIEAINKGAKISEFTEILLVDKW